MFPRIARSKGHSYLQILESYREDGRSKQRVVANLGNVDTLAKTPGLERIADRLLQIAGVERMRPEELAEKERLCYGHFPYRKLWKRLGIDSLLGEAARRRRIRFDLEAAVFLMAADRLLSPRSKLACHGAQGGYLGLPAKVELNHLYRALDVLAEEKKRLEEELFERRRDLFNMRVSVALYDVTTFHFESVRAGELRRFGFSKAGKFNEVQVVLGLLTDETGCPVGFDLFPGNTAEGKTLLAALEKLRSRFEIAEVVIAADSAINTGENLAAIERAGYRFVVASPLRRAPAGIKNAALSEEGYRPAPGGEESDKLLLKEAGERRRRIKDAGGKETEIATRVVCSWSPKRAEKDARDRHRLVEKARAIEQGAPVSDKRGHRRYLKTKGKTCADGIDQARIESDALWDGFHAIETNDREASGAELYAIYRQLWRIEQSFRIMKSTMETRPIYHWTAKRIEGHFVLCFLAFVLERSVELKLDEKQVPASAQAIAEALGSLEVSRLQIGEKDYYLKGANKPLANKILRALGVAPLKNLTETEALSPP